MTRFEGQACLVTGAGRGIGAAIAHRMAEEGAGVAVCDLNEEGTHKVTEELKAKGLKAIGIVCDAANLDQMRAAVAQVVKTYGRLDAMFNNAGVPCMAPLEQITEPQFHRIMGINAYSVVVGTQVAAEVMRPQGGGKIVNTCSSVAKVAIPGHVLYSATKYAVRGMTVGFARELARYKILVNAICPGATETPLWNDIVEQYRAFGEEVSSEKIMEDCAVAAAMKRCAVPADMVGAATFLASSGANYITGQCLNVDGGMNFD